MVTELETIPIDWQQARRFLESSLSRKLFREDSATLEDLTQEALIRLVRALRSQDVLNVEGLMQTIAERTMIDYLRSRRIWQKEPTIDPYEHPEHEGLHVVDDKLSGQSLELLEFTVLEYFQEVNSTCLELARYYFAEQNWLEVARLVGSSHTAVRKQWSRCVNLLRDAARADGGSLWEWA